MNQKQKVYVKKVEDALNSDASRDMSKKDYLEALEEIDGIIEGMLDCVREEVAAEDDE